MMRIEPSVRVGDLISVAGFIIAIVAGYYSIKIEIGLIEHEVTGIRATIRQISGSVEAMAQAMTKLAVTETRLNRIEMDIGRLEDGHSKLRDRIDGPYLYPPVPWSPPVAAPPPQP